MKAILVALLTVSAPALAAISGLTVNPVSYPNAVSALAPDSTGGAWAVDPGSKVLVHLNLTAGTFTTVPVPMQSTAGLYNLAVTPDDSVWYADFGNSVIGRLAPNGAFSVFATPSAAFAVADGPDNGVFYNTLGGDKIGHIYGPPDFTIQEFPLPSNVGAGSLAVGPDGAVYFVDLVGGLVPRDTLGRCDASGNVTVIPAALPNPSETFYAAITMGPDGNMWFTHGTSIGRLRLSDMKVTEYPIPYAMAGAGGICTGGDGNIWFADSAAGAGVISQLVVSSATDDGHATINPSQGLGEPIGIWLLSPSSGATIDAKIRPELDACPPTAFVIEQNRSSGSNLNYAIVSPTGNNCADLALLPNSLSVTDPTKFTLTFGIVNNGPASANPPTLLVTPLAGVAGMFVGSLDNWSCNRVGLGIQCTRNNAMAPGDFDAAYFVIDMVLDPRTPLPDFSEVDLDLFSSTPDPIPLNNWFSVKYAPASHRSGVNLHETGERVIHILPGRD